MEFTDFMIKRSENEKAKYDKVCEAIDKINERIISEGYFSLSDLLVPVEEEKLKLYFENAKTQKELNKYKELMDSSNLGVVTKFDGRNLHYKLHNGYIVSIFYAYGCYGYEQGLLELEAWPIGGDFLNDIIENQCDSVIGNLTGEEAFELAKKVADRTHV